MSDQDRPPEDSDRDPADGLRIVDDDGPALRFGEDDTGPLPHWTEPPTGEVPRALSSDQEDVDVWSTFATQAPVWRDDAAEPEAVDFTPLAESLPPVQDELGTADMFEPPVTAENPPVVTIGARDRTGDQSRPVGARPTGTRTRPQAPVPAARQTTGGRDLPIAIAVGAGLAAAYLLLANLGPTWLLGLVAVVVFLAAVEFYEKVREKGYQPATLVGLVAVLALPLAAFWKGESALPLVVVLAVATTAAWFMFAGGIDVGPLPNMAITMFGVVYIGVLGSYAALLLHLEDLDPAFSGIGILSVTILGVVANDIGALFFGSSTGRTPMATWISPNKTWEGAIGGALATAVAVVLANVFDLAPYSGSWVHTVALIVTICIAAPLGDLTESLIKRNLGIKDFGTLLPAHGGILDRFDGLLFTLPAVYYLSMALEPWAS